MRLLLLALLLGHLMAGEADASAADARAAEVRAAKAAAGFAALPPVAMHLELGEPRPVTAELRVRFTAPHLVARTWQFFAARPPEREHQRVIAAAFDLRGYRATTDASRPAKPILVVQADARPETRSEATATVRWEVELRSRRLFDGAPERPVAGPAAPERLAAMTHDEWLGWDHPLFQAWLDLHGLRPRADERDLDFARRAHAAVRTLMRYSYRPEMDRRTLATLANEAGDCASLSYLFASALRANGIPARVVNGRWARSAVPGDLLDGSPYYQTHARAEFAARGIGWIPCDESMDLRRPEAWFGEDGGDFITLHDDPGLQLDTLFGRRQIEGLQGISFWVKGDGDLSELGVDTTYTVTP